jgi:hypothetical protein
MIKLQVVRPTYIFGILAIIVAALFGILASSNSTTLLVIIGLVFTIFSSIILISIKYVWWWRLWLSLIFIAAFGPFLDILTGQPINWVIGFAVLVLFIFNQFVHFLRRVFSTNRSVSPRLVFPILGSLFLLYNIYFFLQSLRPDGSVWNGLMAFRISAIGLSAYFLTFSGFQRGMNQDEVLKRLRQFLLIFVVVGLIVAAYGIFQFLVGFERLQAWGLTDLSVRYHHNQRNLNGGTPIFRIFGTLRRNETLGIFMYLNIVACVVSTRFGLRPKWLLGGSFILSLVAMLLTLSLTSNLLFILWILMVVITSQSFKRSIQTLSLGVIGLVVIFIGNQLLGGIIETRLAEHVLDTQQGIGRVKMSQNWIAEIGDRSFSLAMFGSGICTGLDEGSFNRIQNILGKIGIDEDVSKVVCGWSRPVYDNWFATHSLEIGLVGLGIFWSIFFVIIISTIPRLTKRWQQPYRSGWRMLALGVFAIWPSGFVGALIGYMPITVYFWSLVALIEAGSYARAVLPNASSAIE